MPSNPPEHPVELLRGVPRFADCADAELDQIAALTWPRTADTGAVLVTEGEPGADFFVIAPAARSELRSQGVS